MHFYHNVNVNVRSKVDNNKDVVILGHIIILSGMTTIL